MESKKINIKIKNRINLNKKYGWGAMWLDKENKIQEGTFSKKSEVPKGAFGIHRCRIYRVRGVS